MDVPQFARLLPLFIARAIYDGAVSYRYITDAEVSQPGESEEEENLFTSVIDIFGAKPIEYRMKNLWNSS